MRPPVVAPAHAQQLRGELEGQRTAVETILSRAAQVLGLRTRKEVALKAIEAELVRGL